MHRRDLVKLSPLAVAATVLSRTGSSQPQVLTTRNTLFSVRDFGATGDGQTVDTPAINQAIEAVAAAGGGTLVFPAGKYMCFTIRLRSHVELHLSQGCTIIAADSPKPGESTGYRGGVYDPAGPPQPWEKFDDYGHNHWNNSLIVGDGISDFSITGPGLIYGAGLSKEPPGGDNPETGEGYPYFVGNQPGVGNKAIALKNCHNVLLRDFSILKGGHFGLLATGVDNLTIDNLIVDTDRDGMDIDCCRNVRVTNCTVSCRWDDAICPKSSFSLGYNRPTENLTIANCYVTGAYELGAVVNGTWKETRLARGNGRIKLGTESNGGFRNIAITNCVIEGSKGIAIETADGALVEDIAISNITMRNTFDSPLFVRLSARNRGPQDAMRPGILRRVLISNIVAHNSAAKSCSMLAGMSSNLVEDIKISNCFFDQVPTPEDKDSRAGTHPPRDLDWRKIAVPDDPKEYPDLGRFGILPANGLFVRHLRNLELSHVEIRPSNEDKRPALWLENVHRADVFAFTAPSNPGIVLRDVTDFRLSFSRAAKDTSLTTAKDQTL